MIFIHTRARDETTIDIIQWLIYYKKDFFRLNTIRELAQLQASLPHDQTGSRQPAFQSCYLNGKSNLIPPVTEDKDLDRQLRTHLTGLADTFIESLLDDPAVKRFGNHPFGNNGINKLIALQVARRAGLSVPQTAIVSDKSNLIQLKEQWGRIIHKSMHQGIAVNTDNVLISGQKTEEVTDDTIARLGNVFFPSMIQQLVLKKFEIRVFCFGVIVRAIAIFTQRNAHTQIDGRGIDTQRPNRQVPFALPEWVKTKLLLVMERLKLCYGSFDLICTPDNEFVFLEVNPYGQYGFLSMAGNFYIEKQIAEYL